MEVSSDSEEEEGAEEEESDEEVLVSFDDVMDAADRAVDAFESSVLSRVSDTRVSKRACNLTPAAKRRRLDLILVKARNRSVKYMSPESSDTEYSSDTQVSITIDGPVKEETCECACSNLQGLGEPIFIHLSSDSEEDVQID